ncbi:MAG: cytochrome c oxidase accessory protein CcoG [Bdellovibrio sp.]|nr:MAG: cytochrome c oxidase accessory protein CcoG [Bdellovibrio sp.]
MKFLKEAFLKSDPQQAFRDKLSMLDETGHRNKIYPARVSGFFRRYRDLTQVFLILIFLALPWMRVGGAQAVLFDLPRRQFAIFGLTFWAHDGPLVFLVAGSAAVCLFLMTAMLGRVWCGWACPQTVFLDGVFRRIEGWIEGSHLQRRELDRQGLSFQYLRKKGFKWLLFFVLSSLFAHSFIAYFTGADELLRMIREDPAQNMTPFLFVTIISLLLTFNFGWFREQLCIVVCPYGRFQSVLLDPHSITVMYDSVRGEPRKGVVKTDEKPGDCISCTRCVQVCPTGIDIRNASGQLECIACTACIDACDEVMKKINKPAGLIRYGSWSQQPLSQTWRRPRIVTYFVVLAGFLAALVYSVGSRKDLDAQILRAKESPYVVLPTSPGEKKILNHFHLHLHNQTSAPTRVRLKIPDEFVQRGVTLGSPGTEWDLASHEFKQIHFFVLAPPPLFIGTGNVPFYFLVNDERLEVQLVGPAN